MKKVLFALMVSLMCLVVAFFLGWAAFETTGGWSCLILSLLVGLFIFFAFCAFGLYDAGTDEPDGAADGVVVAFAIFYALSILMYRDGANLKACFVLLAIGSAFILFYWLIIAIKSLVSHLNSNNS